MISTNIFATSTTKTILSEFSEYGGEKQPTGKYLSKKKKVHPNTNTIFGSNVDLYHVDKNRISVLGHTISLTSGDGAGYFQAFGSEINITREQPNDLSHDGMIGIGNSIHLTGANDIGIGGKLTLNGKNTQLLGSDLTLHTNNTQVTGNTINLHSNDSQIIGNSLNLQTNNS